MRSPVKWRPTSERTISRSEARQFYDQFGARQDRQGFYEDAALDRLVEIGNFSTAQRVFELGCGTGRFAARLLENYLPPSAHYVGVDLSPTMTHLAIQRLSKFGERCAVLTSDGGFDFSGYPGPFDRIVSTYVLDLLSVEDIHKCLAGARTVIAEGGLFCHAGLTVGTGPISRTTSALWSLIHRINPLLVGGCRPLIFTEVLTAVSADLMPANEWRVIDRQVVVSSAIASEVVVAQAR